MVELDHGYSREKQVRDIAASLGIADFVYTSSPTRKGNALREVAGDGLIIAGERGAVLQVKAREPGRANLDSSERAEAWLRKNATKARNQGLGTRRELERRRLEGEEVCVCPVRALELPEDRRGRYLLHVSQSCENWPIIVVLDHPLAFDVDLGFDSEVVWITPSDWRELHLRLRSTGGLLEYVRRCLESAAHVPLGHEEERYSFLRRREDPIPSVPSPLPFLVHESEFDQLGAELYHDVIEKVWPDDGIVPWKSAEEYRTIVEFLDAVPPAIQAGVGRWFLKKRRELAQGHITPSGLAVIGDDRLVYACSNLGGWRDYDDWLSELAAVATLRHTQALETGAPDSTTTMMVGALIDGDPNGGISYSFVLLRSRDALRPLPPDLRRYFEWRYGLHNHSQMRTTPLEVGPKQACPCLGGKLFGECCGSQSGV